MSIVSIALKNSKLGNIPNISLLPIVSCAKNIVCGHWTKCYAIKFVKIFPAVFKAWKKNTDLALSDLSDYFTQLHSFLGTSKKSVFRYHVGGDILNQRYLDLMVITAAMFPNIDFLAFTKKFELDFSDVQYTSNFEVMFSMWSDQPIPDNPYNFRFAWVDDGVESRIPKDVKVCSGKCEDCLFCWSPTSDVVMPKH